LGSRAPWSQWTPQKSERMGAWSAYCCRWESEPFRKKWGGTSQAGPFDSLGPQRRGGSLMPCLSWIRARDNLTKVLLYGNDAAFDERASGCAEEHPGCSQLACRDGVYGSGTGRGNPVQARSGVFADCAGRGGGICRISGQNQNHSGDERGDRAQGQGASGSRSRLTLSYGCWWAMTRSRAGPQKRCLSTRWSGFRGLSCWRQPGFWTAFMESRTVRLRQHGEGCWVWSK
jgi:hypothetical protein